METPNTEPLFGEYTAREAAKRKHQLDKDLQEEFNPDEVLAGLLPDVPAGEIPAHLRLLAVRLVGARPNAVVKLYQELRSECYRFAEKRRAEAYRESQKVP